VRNQILIISLFLLLPIATSTSLGVWPAQKNITILPLEAKYEKLYIFNPGSTDVEIEVKISCTDPDIINYISFNPTTFVVEKNTLPENPKEINLFVKNPIFIRRNFHIKISEYELVLPYYETIINKRTIECRLIATTAKQPMQIAVTSKMNLELIGFKIEKIVLLLLLILLILIYRKKPKKK